MLIPTLKESPFALTETPIRAIPQNEGQIYYSKTSEQENYDLILATKEGPAFKRDHCIRIV